MDFKLFDTLLEPVFIINAAKKVVYCNEPAALLCDISARKIQRAGSFEEVLSFKDERLEYLDKLTDVHDPTPYRELNFESSSGKSGKAQITVQPFPYHKAGSEAVWIMFFRDVTLEETLQKKYRAELEQKEDVILDLQKAQAALQEYSKNLEKMVDERTAEIKSLNQTMVALLDSLGQGFFIFDRSGQCLKVYSKACLNTVECEPAGKMTWEVFKIPSDKVEGFKKWMFTVFSEMLPFEDLTPLAPNRFEHSQNKHISLEYYPLRSSENTLESIVVVASDITDLVQAQQDAESERAHAKMITTLVKNKRGVLGFIQETRSIMTLLKDSLHHKNEKDYDTLFRCLHTLKGGAASFSVQHMMHVCHEAENILAQLNSPEGDKAQIWQKLDEQARQIEKSFQDFLSENTEILGQNIESQGRTAEISVQYLIQTVQKIQSLSGGGALAQEISDTFIMEPVGHFFESYNQVAIETAERLGKNIKPVEWKNSNLPVWPEPYNHLFSSFVHAFRNAVDHGIESPLRRQELGKPEQGRIQVRFSQIKCPLKTCLQIEISDDGSGINPKVIREKLLLKGYNSQHESDDDVIQHVFDSSFSTRSEVTETSGRGVGMDAIKAAAEKLGGHARVSSQVGKGTTLTVVVPEISLQDSQHSRFKKSA